MIEFILACFAVFRLAELIAIDDGPDNVLLSIRAKLGAYDLDDDGFPATSIGRGITCPHCVSVWLAALAALMVAPHDWQMGLWWFAIAGGASFLQSVGGRQ